MMCVLRVWQLGMAGLCAYDYYTRTHPSGTTHAGTCLFLVSSHTYICSLLLPPPLFSCLLSSVFSSLLFSSLLFSSLLFSSLLFSSLLFSSLLFSSPLRCSPVIFCPLS